MWRSSLLLLLPVLLTACGGESAPESADAPGVGDASAPVAATSEGPSDACALLPAEQVEAVLGQAVRDSLAMSMGGEAGLAALSQCNYATEANPALVSLLLRRMTPEESVDQASGSLRQTLEESGIALEAVDGLGQASFWGGNQLHIITDDWYLVVTPDPAGGPDQGRALAERALAEL